MEEASNDLRKTLAKESLILNRSGYNRILHRRWESIAEDGECDGDAWETFSSAIERTQSVLDQNRALIQLVNENHQSKVPENLVKNVALIREINGNINKVKSIYSDIFVNFTDLVRQRNAMSKNSYGNVKTGDKGGSDVLDDAFMH